MYNQLIIPSFENENVHLGSTSSEVAGQLSPPHYHDEIEILYVYEGALHIMVNGAENVLRAGSLMLLSPRIPHATSFHDEGGKYYMLQFRLENYLGMEHLREIRSTTISRSAM